MQSVCRTRFRRLRPIGQVSGSPCRAAGQDSPGRRPCGGTRAGPGSLRLVIELAPADTVEEALPLGPVVEEHPASGVAGDAEQHPVRARACGDDRAGDERDLKRAISGARSLPCLRGQIEAKLRDGRLGPYCAQTSPYLLVRQIGTHLPTSRVSSARVSPPPVQPAASIELPTNPTFTPQRYTATRVQSQDMDAPRQKQPARWSSTTPHACRNQYHQCN